MLLLNIAPVRSGSKIKSQIFHYFKNTGIASYQTLQVNVVDKNLALNI